MRRRGITRVEVAIVVFLAVVIGGLLLPVLMPVNRRCGLHPRTMTNNNLKQCAVAVHIYHDIHKRFPDGFGDDPKFASKVPVWFQLLPFVEAENTYMNGVGTGVVPAYLSPSDILQDDLTGRLNFAANVRIFGYQSIGKHACDRPGEALTLPKGSLLSGLTLPRIPDGAANTILMSTRYSSCGGQQTYYAVGPFGEGDLPIPPRPGVGGFMGAGSHSTPPRKDGPATAMFQLAPTEPGCLPDPGVFGHSFGSGGMSVALADASVRNIVPTMSPSTVARALCPADGNPLAGDWNDD